MQVQQQLSNEQLIRAVPAIGAEHPAERVSGIYKQVRTIEVVDILRDQGWMPVRARAMNVRSVERGQFCKHEIRFQRENDRSLSAVGDETIQMILVNSHDAGSCYHVMLGVFRLACSNGMVVQTSSFQDIRIRHVGFNPQEIIKASARVGEAGKLVGEQVNAMRGVQLLPEEQAALSGSAAMLLFDPEDVSSHRIQFEPARLNTARRYDDKGNDLWKTFNRIQENVTKGGVRYMRQDQENGRYAGVIGAPQDARYARARLHQVKSIDRDIRLNQALWALAEKMLELKTK
jgi:hypothetical protein